MVPTPGPVPNSLIPLVDSPRNLRITETWRLWLVSVLTYILFGIIQASSVSRDTQGAAIVTTAMYTPSKTGLYRISWYLRITRAATTSSSATVTIGWTDAGQACTSAGAAVVGNTVTTVQSGSIVVSADSLTDLTYAVAYASVGATSMQYKLRVSVEAIP